MKVKGGGSLTEFDEKLLIYFIIGFFAVVALIGIISHILRYREDIWYIKRSMYHADSGEEYQYWKHQLHICRLSIIPGLTPHAIETILCFFHRKSKNRSDNIMSTLFPSTLCIVLCSVCLAGSTFAWFTASQSTSAQTISAANYEIKVIVSDNTKNITAENGMYNLEAKTKYHVTLIAQGSATTGYCIIKLYGKELHTEQFPTEKEPTKMSLEFDIQTDEKTSLQIIGQWGSSSKTEREKITNGSTYQHNKIVSAEAEQQ